MWTDATIRYTIDASDISAEKPQLASKNNKTTKSGEAGPAENASKADQKND